MDILLAKGIATQSALHELLRVRTDGADERYHFVHSGSLEILATGATVVREHQTYYVFDGQFSSAGNFYHPLMMGDWQALKDTIDRTLRDAATPPNGVFLLGKISLGPGAQAALITDWLGQYPVYIWSARGAFLVSNNLLFLKVLLPGATRSLGPALDNLVFGGSPAPSHLTDVELLPLGSMIRAGESLQLEPRSDHQSPGLNYRETLKTARNEIAAHVASVFRAAGSSATVVSDITGGADTRAVLSFLLLQDSHREFAVRCLGEYPNPDANVAGQMIETFALKQAVFPHQQVSVEEQIRYNAALSGGACDAGGIGWPVALTDLVHFKGSFGEVGGASPGADYIAMAGQDGDYSPDKAINIFLSRRKRAGALDLATAEAIQSVHARFSQLIGALEEQSFPRQHIIAELYLRTRCRTHFGLPAFLGNKSYILPSPLANRWLVEARRLLPAHLHRNNQVILDLILQNGQAQLAFLPMANRKWDACVVPPACRTAWLGMHSIDFCSPPMTSLVGPLYRSVAVSGPESSRPPMLALSKATLQFRHLVQSRYIAPYQELLSLFLHNLDHHNEVWRVFDRDIALSYVRRKPEEFRPSGIDTNAMGIVLSGIAWSTGFEIPPHVSKQQQFRVLAD